MRYRPQSWNRFELCKVKQGHQVQHRGVELTTSAVGGTAELSSRGAGVALRIAPTSGRAVATFGSLLGLGALNLLEVGGVYFVGQKPTSKGWHSWPWDITHSRSSGLNIASLKIASLNSSGRFRLRSRDSALEHGDGEENSVKLHDDDDG